MVCTSPVQIKVPVKGLVGVVKEMEVPCGKCLACRIKQRAEWSMRCLHELSYWDKACFVTLTYKDNPLSLSKRDLQLFFKRLRKNLNGRSIKYFAAGEYGDKTFRPHYHVLLYGVGLDNDDKVSVMASWPYADWSVPSIRRRSFGLVEADSIRYVCQYIDKKFSGELAEEVYYSKGLEAPFRLLSKGIGLRYCEDNAKQILDLGYITVKGVKNSVPRYYLKKLGVDGSFLADYAYYNDCEFVEKATGLNIASGDLYKTLNASLIFKYQDALLKFRKTRRLNLQAKVNLKKLREF